MLFSSTDLRKFKSSEFLVLQGPRANLQAPYAGDTERLEAVSHRLNTKSG